MAGGVSVTLLLAAGMLSSISGLEDVASTQMEHIRAQEQEITLVERLRWNGELIASAGRAYLISQDPALLAQLLRVRRQFDQGILALRPHTLTSQGELLVAAVEDNARRFVRVQEDLAAARNLPKDVRSLVLRFERELLPLQRQLSQSLDDLVEHKEAALDDIYSQADKERHRFAIWMYSLLATLILLGLVVTAHFAKQTARAYRKERDALDIARKAVAARDDLMGMVAHDLRNPLFAVAIRVQVLHRLAESEATLEQARSITTITTRMEHLIDSMLDVTNLEAGRFSVSPASCAVEQLMHESFAMFDLLATARQVRLAQRLEETGLVVCADRERVLQLLSNLIGNALKFAPQGSEVTVSVERQQRMVRFAVRDTGQGILAENLRHIFDRFWKRNSAGNNGTGLGLFIAKGIVEAHGGQIWVESEPGCGAAFYFTLPLVPAPKTKAATIDLEDEPNLQLGSRFPN